MKLFSQSLILQLEHQLKIIDKEKHNPLQYSEQAIKILISILEKLKTNCVNYKFLNKLDEIEFFREIKPQFTSKLIYYNEIYNIETGKPSGSKKAIRKYYINELQKLNLFFKENQEFYRYYRTNNRSLDSKYFVRGKHDIRFSLDSFYFQVDHRFSTSHDYKLARILANDLIRKYLDAEITKITHKTKDFNTIKQSNKNPKWTASKVELIELIYALHAEGVFNNGTTALKEITSFFESCFNIELGQFNRVFLEIRNRKSERTKFLNKLKHQLIVRMEEADEN